VLTALCGGVMLLQVQALPTLTRLAYTGFDVGLTLILVLTIGLQVARLVGAANANPVRVDVGHRA